jgi:hypothetical protein
VPPPATGKTTADPVNRVAGGKAPAPLIISPAERVAFKGSSGTSYELRL